MIKEAIAKIVRREDLTFDEAYTVMNEIMSGKQPKYKMQLFWLLYQPRVPIWKPLMKSVDALPQCEKKLHLFNVVIWIF